MSERLRVLLVEDNPADADLIRETLLVEGPVSFRLEAVARLAEARERVRRGDLDVILLDLGLPDSQGIATFKSLQEVAADIPTIVLTGNDDQEMAVAAVRQGAQDYLIKGQVVGNLLARAARYAVERKRADEALRESERKLKEAQRLGRIGHWEFDLAAHSLLWSEEVFAIYERDPALGPPSVEDEAAYYAPEDATRLRVAGAAAVETGEPYESEVQINLPGGRLKHVVAIGTPVRGSHGRIVKLLGTIQDITRRKLAEEALREQKDRAQQYLDVAGTMFVAIDLAGIVTMVNQAGCRILGYPQQEIVGRNWFDCFLTPEARESIRAVSRAVLEEAAAGEYHETAVLTGGGETRLIAWHNVPIRDAAGRITGQLSSGEDVTERRRAEERFRTLYETSHAAIVTLAPPSWRLTGGNPAAIAMFQARDEADLTSRTLWELSPERQPEGKSSADTSLEMIETAMNHGSHRFDWVHRRLTGEVFPAAARLTRMKLGGVDQLQATVHDVTERRRSQELQLAKADVDRYAGALEQRLQSVLETIPDALFSVDASLGDLFYVSQGALAVFGYPPDELVADPQLWRRSIHEDDLAAVLAAFRRAVEQRLPQTVEFRYQASHGDRRWLNLRVGAAIERPGAGARLDGVARDVTERRRAEDALRESERAFRETLRHLDEAYYCVTPDGLILDHNLAFNRVLGIDAGQDLRGRHTPDFWLNPDDRQAYLNELMGKEIVRNYQAAVKTRSGEKRTVLLNAHMEKDNLGNMMRIVGTMTDISELKGGEERIVHLNRILRAVRDINQLIVRERNRQRLIEDACGLLVGSRGYNSTIIVLTDAAGVPWAWAEAGMGDGFRPLAESLRRGVMPPCCRLAQQREGLYHVTDSAAVCAPCPIWAHSDGADSSCIQLRHGETTYGYLAVSVDRALHVDAEEDSLLGEVAGDVAYALHGIERAETMTQVESDRDRAENELRQSQKMQAVGTLAGGVAHDFNNLLTVINTTCSFLEEGLHESEPLLVDVRTIRDAAQSAAQLTRQLLAFSRRQVLEPRPLALDALVGESEKMLRRLIGEDITIRVEAAPDLSLVLADPGQIEQVIVNLAVNARDAMPEGGTLAITTANVEADEAFVLRHPGSRTGRYVRLTVTDSGCGMDAETQGRIFEPFFTTKAMGKGTGLGLPTVYGIVKQSGGFVDVDSAPGRGATFDVYLPRAESTDQPWHPAEMRAPSRGRGETILLVEDESDLRRAIARGLKKLGYQVFDADGLAAASRIAATERPIHLLLTDVVMPGGSGRDVSAAVLAAHPAVKVLYMSGFADDVIVHRGVLEKGVAFLPKPFSVDTLGRKVSEVLDS